jgi:hypothetical protein
MLRFRMGEQKHRGFSAGALTQLILNTPVAKYGAVLVASGLNGHFLSFFL